MGSAAQEKIDLERDTGRIAAELLRMAPQGLIIKALYEYTGIGVNRLIAVLLKMQEGELVYYDKASGYHLTSQGGVEFAEGLLKNADLDTLASTLAFKDEALTGTTVHYCKKGRGLVSEKSELTRAVLPKGVEQREYKTPEDSFLEHEGVRVGKLRLAAKLGIDEATMDKFWNEGRIKDCKGCGETEVFDKKCDRLQNLCRKCTKKRRNQK